MDKRRYLDCGTDGQNRGQMVRVVALECLGRHPKFNNCRERRGVTQSEEADEERKTPQNNGSSNYQTGVFRGIFYTFCSFVIQWRMLVPASHFLSKQLRVAFKGANVPWCEIAVCEFKGCDLSAIIDFSFKQLGHPATPLAPLVRGMRKPVCHPVSFSVGCK